MKSLGKTYTVLGIICLIIFLLLIQGCAGPKVTLDEAKTACFNGKMAAYEYQDEDHSVRVACYGD